MALTPLPINALLMDLLNNSKKKQLWILFDGFPVFSSAVFQPLRLTSGQIVLFVANVTANPC